MSLRGTDLSYAPPGGPCVLRDVSVEVPPGQTVALGGASGAGKTTLARLLAGHLLPDAGRIEADGAGLSRRGRPRAVQYAPQSAEMATDPRWTIRQILANGPPPAEGVPEALGICPSWAGRYPAELSGGELQRVSLARLLGPQTRYLICDEISAQLDALSQAELWDRLGTLCRARGIGLLVISHDPALRRRLTPHSLVLSQGCLTEAV